MVFILNRLCVYLASFTSCLAAHYKLYPTIILLLDNNFAYLVVKINITRKFLMKNSTIQRFRYKKQGEHLLVAGYTFNMYTPGQRDSTIFSYYFFF